MVLAAGLGKRLRPITDTLPKPLVVVAGRTLLDRSLDALASAGVARAVVNCHYLAPMIEAHLGGRAAPRIHLSNEENQLLETGGGVKRALAHLGDDPFLVINADIAWEDADTPALNRLAAAWQDGDMDALLLLHPVAAASGYDGVGDYDIEGGRLSRRRDRPSAPYVFTGIQILHPRLFEGAPDGPFSLTTLYDKAEAAGRLYGLIHDGAWYHIGTQAGLEEAESRLRPYGS
jgi:MurNAc alpha-1-phosphate uridylyltransferase